MKKALILIISMALCVTIAACSSNRAVTTDGKSENPPPPASAVAPEPPANTTTTAPANTPAVNTAGPELADKSDDMYNAYADALENLLQNHKFPDGTDADPGVYSGDQNKFALCDVDNDGKEELLIMYSNVCMAGMVGCVFAYDAQTKELQTELREFPALTFYDNGVVKADWSHNQGLAGDSLLPYSLYQYAPESDSYVLVGMVDAWDKNLSETDDENHPFPRDIDTSGTGIVYYIMKDAKYDTSHPVDASVYNEWIDTYIGNASEIQIRYVGLTDKNISQLRNGLQA